MLVRFGWLIAFVVWLVAGSAAAQDDREGARVEFEAGRTAFEARQFETALGHFQEAYRLAPHPNVRVNIANCYDQLDRPVEALFHYEHFLAEAQRPPPAQRREIEEAIRRLRGRVGSITFQVTPDGAQITIDGSETRRAPVAEPVRVVAGEHRIEIRLPGYAAERRTIEVAGGQTLAFVARLQRAELAVVPPANPEPVEPVEPEPAIPADVPPTRPERPTRVVTPTRPDSVQRPDEPYRSPTQQEGLRINEGTAVAGITTVAALAGAGVTGLLAVLANDRFERAVVDAHDLAMTDAQRAEAIRAGESAASEAQTLALVTDVLLITAAVGAGLTTVLLVTGQDAHPDEPSVTLVPVLDPNFTGAMAYGRF